MYATFRCLSGSLKILVICIPQDAKSPFTFLFEYPFSIPAYFHICYAGVSRNMHAESIYLKKEQEHKKEMKKYKVGFLCNKSVRHCIEIGASVCKTD